MKKRNRLQGLLFFAFIGGGIPVEGLAFGCLNTGGTSFVEVDPSVFRNNPVTFSTMPGNPTIADPGTSDLTHVPPAGSGFYCQLDYAYGDRAGITAIRNIHSAIGSTDYTSSIKIGDTGIPLSPAGGSYTFSNVHTACLFCGGLGGLYFMVNTPVITVSLTRTANWVAKPIANGDTLLSLTVRRTDLSQPIGTIVFRVSGGDVSYPTCTITNPGNRTVTLPPVPKSDLQSTGTGRYNAVKGEFSFNMNCAEGTKVKVKFEGDKLTGEDYALINKAPGGLNTAVGIQIVERSSNTAMKIDEAETVFNPAATGGNILNFDAYYFKGVSGTIDGGPIVANATYTFTYE